MTNKEFASLQAGARPDAAYIARLINGLRDCTLPESEWTNAAHYAGAAALLEEVGLAAAEAQMPGYIRRFNESVGGVNSDMEGYHHTITIFLLKRIDKFLKPMTSASLEEKVVALLSSPLVEKTYMLGFYSKDLLFSVKARRDWVAPDLKDIDAD